MNFVTTTVNFVTWLYKSSCSALWINSNCNFAEHFTGQHTTLQAPFTYRLQPSALAIKVSTQTCCISRYSPQSMQVMAEKYMITLKSTSRFSLVQIKCPWPLSGFSLILNRFSWLKCQHYCHRCGLWNLLQENFPPIFLFMNKIKQLFIYYVQSPFTERCSTQNNTNLPQFYKHPN